MDIRSKVDVRSDMDVRSKLSQLLDRMYADAEFYWGEKSRLACHENIISIYNLHKLYDAPPGGLASPVKKLIDQLKKSENVAHR